MKLQIPTFHSGANFSGNEQSIEELLIAEIDDRKKIFERQFPHRHSYYEIVMLEQSSGVHYIDFKPYEYSGRIIFLLSPNQVHHLIRDEGRRGFSIQFGDSFFYRNSDESARLYSYFLYDHFQANPVISLTDVEWDRITFLASVMLQEYRNDSPDSIDMFFEYLRILLLETIRAQKVNFNQKCQQLGASQQQIIRFKQLLDSHFSTQHEVQYYADQLNITPRRLNLLAKKMLNETAFQVIKDRLILEAKRLLAINVNIKEVGYRLGFEDPAHFSRFFKQAAGFTAGEFKTMTQNIGYQSETYV